MNSSQTQITSFMNQESPSSPATIVPTGDQIRGNKRVLLLTSPPEPSKTICKPSNKRSGIQ